MKRESPTLESLLARIESLETENTLLRAENAELKRRLNQNSRNSSKPPSSDGLRKPKVNKDRSLREKGKRKSGGQPGHKGYTLNQVVNPDHRVKHTLPHCPECTHDLSSVSVDSTERRQVFDIPKPQLAITEHCAEIKTCPYCQSRVKASFPVDVKAPVQYGANIGAWSVYLSTQHFIPEDRLQQLFSDLYDLKIATASLSGFNEALFNNLDGFSATVKDLVSKAAIKHLDETGYRMAGKTGWLHTASTETLTYYHVSPKRKSLLSDLEGTVVHDHWKPYFQLSGVSHALCNAHHLRELNARIDEGEPWAKQMKRLLLLMLKIRHRYGDQAIPAKRLDCFIGLYGNIVTEGLAYHQSMAKIKTKTGRPSRAKRKGHNLLLRLQNHCADVLRFLLYPVVPFTNNLAEQDLRMMKCKQKISGGFKTQRGAEVFARDRSFISTARKQGWNILDSISLALKGNAPIPA